VQAPRSKPPAQQLVRVTFVEQAGPSRVTNLPVGGRGGAVLTNAVQPFRQQDGMTDGFEGPPVSGLPTGGRPMPGAATPTITAARRGQPSRAARRALGECRRGQVASDPWTVGSAPLTPAARYRHHPTPRLGGSAQHPRDGCSRSAFRVCAGAAPARSGGIRSPWRLAWSHCQRRRNPWRQAFSRRRQAIASPARSTLGRDRCRARRGHRSRARLRRRKRREQSGGRVAGFTWRAGRGPTGRPIPSNRGDGFPDAGQQRRRLPGAARRVGPSRCARSGQEQSTLGRLEAR
jgi:hypothetical protein